MVPTLYYFTMSPDPTFCLTITVSLHLLITNQMVILMAGHKPIFHQYRSLLNCSNSSKNANQPRKQFCPKVTLNTKTILSLNLPVKHDCQQHLIHFHWSFIPKHYLNALISIALTLSLPTVTEKWAAWKPFYEKKLQNTFSMILLKTQNNFILGQNGHNSSPYYSIALTFFWE